MRIKLTFLAILLLATALLGGVKLTPRKYYKNNPSRIHPHESLINKQPARTPDQRSENFQKLLVILVDFQEEATDDPNTTGNGKFQLQVDLSYVYPVASPPHNRQYFLNNLEALRYYYLAASAGSYDLEYEVYPSSGAYTLPHPMGYYNPPNAGGDLFLARMEEYFKDSFELADSLSPEIDFSAYDHFMIIHAGSDWQHDIFGNTPSDIPSFFINVTEGKEAFVDEGAVLIGHACNVPSTISQDFYAEVQDGTVIHAGYGALNAVIAHEFGHSLGFVDLYDVSTFQPMVGVFDIMDSGGSGILVDQLNDGSLVLVEGALPVLPGAWSRLQAFGDFLQSGGYSLELDQTNLFQALEIAASSQQQSGPTQPQILRVPLAPNEYLLVENRSVDPDGDGGTAVFATDDSRVILYPTPFDDPTNTPSYEYDYLLPSFQKADGSAVGGGILVWRINDDVIHNQGVTDAEGNFYSNYENNTVNTSYARRGVQIIEADNLADIGNMWSWYWTGTQYEYFHRKRPVLDSSGFFVNWSQDDWTPVLNSDSQPPLLDSNGVGSQYWLTFNGNPSELMSLNVNSGFFTSTRIEATGISGLLPGPIINSSYSPHDLPLISLDSITLLSENNGEWSDLMGPYAWNGQPIDHAVISSDQDGNGFAELVMVHDDAMELVEFSQDTLLSRQYNFPLPISTSPLYHAGSLYVSTADCLSIVRNSQVTEFLQLAGIKRLASFGSDVAALCQDIVYLLDPTDLYIKAATELPEPFGAYEPVSFWDQGAGLLMLFLMADSGNLYKYQSGQLRKIFHNTTGSLPTQLGITGQSLFLGETGIVPEVFWGCGSQIYAVKQDGTLLQGYPYQAWPLSFEPREHVYSLLTDDQVSLYLPLPGQGHVAYNQSSGIDWSLSLLAQGRVLGSRVFSLPLLEASRFFWAYAEPEGSVYIHQATVVMEFRIAWSGFRNGQTGVFSQAFADDSPQTAAFDAFVFPNPVRGQSYRLRVENFAQEVKIDIYDINAALVGSLSVPANGILQRDVLLDSSSLASGVYILRARCGDGQKRLKFAVEK